MVFRSLKCYLFFFFIERYFDNLKQQLIASSFKQNIFNNNFKILRKNSNNAFKIILFFVLYIRQHNKYIFVFNVFALYTITYTKKCLYTTHNEKNEMNEKEEKRKKMMY